MTTSRDITEYRPGRNFVRVGDPVRIYPKVGTSFRSKVRRIIDTPTGIEVEAIDPRFGHFRTVTADRVKRCARTRKGDPVER